MTRAKVASLVTLIKQRLNIDAVCTPGKAGQFDVIAGGERVAERGGNWLTRSLGAGYPDLEKVIEQPPGTGQTFDAESVKCPVGFAVLARHLGADYHESMGKFINVDT